MMIIGQMLGNCGCWRIELLSGLFKRAILAGGNASQLRKLQAVCVCCPSFTAPILQNMHQQIPML